MTQLSLMNPIIQPKRPLAVLLCLLVPSKKEFINLLRNEVPGLYGYRFGGGCSCQFNSCTSRY